MISDLKRRIFNPGISGLFNETALEVYRFQSSRNPVYREFISYLGKDYGSAGMPADFPFLPVGFFRDHKVIVDNLGPDIIFESSTTTGSVPSRHFVHDSGLYETSFITAFSQFYGKPEGYMVAALLPSYTERKGSSLVYMADSLIRKTNDPLSGFYGDDPDSLVTNLRKAVGEGKKAILLGVSFALLDLATRIPTDLSGTIIMETGGMKGRRKEITREELHGILKEKFNVPAIHSEYGMTELLSQAYSHGEGLFNPPPWMKVLIRDPYDPLSVTTEPGTTGGINIIDLANLYSCSFIATGDIGKLHTDGSFEVLGRFDNSEIRGCNLMIS